MYVQSLCLEKPSDEMSFEAMLRSLGEQGGKVEASQSRFQRELDPLFPEQWTLQLVRLEIKREKKRDASFGSGARHLDLAPVRGGTSVRCV